MGADVAAKARKSNYFTAEHDVLRSTIRRFLAAEVVPHLTEWEQTKFPDSIFERFGALGFLGLRFPIEWGGQGGDYFSAVVLGEELARIWAGGLGMAIAVQTDMATPPVLQFGTEEQKERFLRPAIAGRSIAALAITEPDAGSDVSGIETLARRDGDDYVISGRKIFITNGVRCHWALVVAKTDAALGHGGFSLFLVEKERKGFVVARELHKLGMHSSDTAELLFDECRVPTRNLLGQEGHGFKHLMWELQGERLIAACRAVAGAQATLEYTIRYVNERRAFGHAIGEFQAIRHRLADLSAHIAAARAFVYETAGRWSDGEYPVLEISQAKLLSTRLAVEVADEAIQMLGGHGYMSEYPVERAWRDARLARIGAGSDEMMREIIAKSIGLIKPR
jgi:alkylation response protein AidB-like acyl-CoA dehydrogenase